MKKITVLLIAACFIFLSSPLNAESLVDLVKTGGAVIQKDGTQTTIKVGNRCVIDYTSFNIETGETVKFIQPGGESEVSINVIGDSASQIKGILSGNGNVILVNPAGITMEEDANITAAGIVLDCGEKGRVNVSGKLDVSGETGGTVRVLGQKVVLSAKAVIDATGLNSGGTVLIGGDYQGKNTDISNAFYTTVAKGVSIRADALNRGNGGKVIVWADTCTDFNGKISSRGGMQQGDGGFVEVSGKKVLIFKGDVDTRAPEGKTGMLLLDPTDITISNGTGDGAADGTDTFSGDPSGSVGTVAELDTGPATIYESELEGLSSTTSVSLQATNNLTIGNLSDNTLSLQTASAYSVQFIADSDFSGVGNFSMDSGDTIVTQGASVRIEGENITTGGITTNGGDLLLFPDLNLDGPGGVTINGAVDTDGGEVSMDLGESFSSSGTITTNGGPVTIYADGGGSVSLSAAINAGTGTVDIDCTSDAVTLDAITAGTLSVDAAGDITHTGVLAVSGTPTFSVTAADSDILLASAANDFDNSVTLLTPGSGSIRNLAFRNVDLVGGITIPSGLNDLTLIFDNTGITMPATTLTGNLTLTAGNDIIDSGNLIVPGTTTLDAGTNDITLNNSNNFGTVTVTAANNVILNDINAITLGDMVTVGGQEITGTAITLNGTTYDSDDGDIIFNNPVTLGANVNIDSDADNDGTDGSISFSGEVNGDYSLSLDADTGSVLFTDDAGGTTPLAALTVASAVQVDLASVITSGAIAVTGTNIDLNGGDYQSSTAAISFTGAVDLDAGAVNTTITSGGGAGDDIQFTSTIDDAGSDTLLVIEAGANGLVTLGGAIGGTNPIGALTVNSDAGTDVTGGITTSNGAVTFNGPVELQGDSAIDSGTADVTFNGAVSSSTGTWTVTFSDNGSVNLNANAAMNMLGGTGDDTFVIDSGVTLTGTLDGAGGNDTLDFSVSAAGRSVGLTAVGSTDGFQGTETSITGGFDNIDVVAGSSGISDSLTGINAASSWDIDGTNTYTSTNTLSFSGFETLNGRGNVDVFNITGSQTNNLNGGGGDDSFVFTDGAALTGSIGGGAGTDVVDYSAYTSAVSIDAGDFAAIESIIGGSTTGDTLIGVNAVNTWNVTGTDAGTLNGIGFSAVENLTGGTNVDNFTFENPGNLSGAVDGGSGNDTLAGDDDGNVFAVTSSDAGTLTGKTTGFSNIENLSGGAGSDTFTISSTLSGTINSLGNTDILLGEGTVAGGFNAGSGSTVAPGGNPGVLSSGNAVFASGSTYSVELNGTTVGTQYDQLDVTGTVTLGGATLDVTLGFTPSPGNEFVLIDNDGTADAVTGTFNGLAEGATVNTLVISYVGGDGNDVVLTATNPPVVTTQAVSSITTITATGNGNITDLGGSAVTQHGVCWSTSTGPTTADGNDAKGAAAATGAFTASITGLTPNTTYYVRAYATNSDGTSYGNEVSFTTDPLAPTVTTQAVSAILGDAATGNGTITDLGAPDPTAHGVCWNTTGTPTISDSYTDEGPALATGTFTSSMTALSSNTTYYVRAYATNTAGTSYGSEVSFTTLTSYPVTYSANGATSGTAPAAQNKTQGTNLVLATNSGNLARTGFDFVGWNTAADGNGTDYAEGATYATDAALDLYAKWSPVLVLSISDDTIYEDGISTTATVTRYDTTSGALTVNLLSSDAAATVPVSVIIPDTEESVSFTVTIVDDGAVDGAVTVTVTGSAAGYGNGADSITILDDEFVDPTSIGGCELWLDSNDLDGDGVAEGTAGETGVTGNAIDTWADKSGMNNDATQGTVAEQAILVNNAADGKAVVRFDGTDDYFAFTEITNIRTVFIVLKESGTANGTSPLLGHNTLTDFARGTSLYIWGATANANVTGGDTYLDGVSVDGTATALSAGRFYVVSVVTQGNVSADQLTRDRAIADSGWMGDIAEVIIYNAVLSDADRVQIETYLADRWPTGAPSGGGGGGGGGGCAPGTENSLPATAILLVFGLGILWHRKK